MANVVGLMGKAERTAVDLHQIMQSSSMIPQAASEAI
jgi:hypothetical protein